MNFRIIACLLFGFCIGLRAESDPAKAADTIGGFLFAHTTKSDYSRLYYSISKDGLKWILLNKGQRIFSDYRGHPDITKGHDGKYYLIGNQSMDPKITIWASQDLITWTQHCSFAPNIGLIPNFKTTIRYIGAPKIFYDQETHRYVITWNSPSQPSSKEDPERFWLSMRTIFVTSEDLVSYSQPRLLFDFDFPTIHTVVRREGKQYVAILKDERIPSFDCPTGKSIRVSTAPTLEGPWTAPTPPITPNYREAPTVVRRPDGEGWYLFYEQYPGIQYGISTARTLSGPWFSRFINDYSMSSDIRHGSVITLSSEEYAALLSAFSNRKP